MAGGGTTTLQATLAAKNTDSTGAAPDLLGAFNTAGSNLIGDATGETGLVNGTNQDQAGSTRATIDPLLGPLQNNGGPTFTQALLSGSPAINGDYSANSPATDQRGVRRPIGPRADIGAYEAPSPPTTPTNLLATPGNTQISLNWTGTTDAVSYNVYRSTTPGGENLTNPINQNPILGTHYTDYGLTNGVKYYYVVRGVNSAGVSLPSIEASATPGDTRVHGEVLTWGDNQSGELGTGTLANRLIAGPIVAPVVNGQTLPPLNKVVQVSGGARFSLALTADGFVYAWGDDTYGQLGDGNYSGSSTVNNNPVPNRVQSEFGGYLTNIIAISAGQDFALALAADGTVYAWGHNQYGQLGNGATDAGSGGFTYNDFFASPVQTSQGGQLAGVVAIAAGGYHSLAVLSDGTVMAWGYNSSGQLGNGTSGSDADSAYPVSVSSLVNAVSVAAGQYFSLALASDGSVYSWGYNNDGELGDPNAFTNETVPVQVSLPSLNAGNSPGVTQIAAGNSHSLALTSDGSVYAWGSDALDQLGDGGNGGSSSANPTQVGTITALEIAAGATFSLAVQVDHTLITWGADASGQLGTGTTATSQQPSLAQTSFGTPLQNIFYAAGGSLHGMAIQNLPPVAARLTYTVGKNITRNVPAPGLLASATDAESDTLTTFLVSPALHGTVTVYANGRFTYVPNTNYVGADSFTYSVSDGHNNSVSATVTLNVVPETLQSIAVTPQTVTTAEGVTQQFTATGTYTDGNTNDLTYQVTWASSNTSVATISNAPTSPGLATTATVNAGQTTITATENNISGTATLTVVRTLQSITVSPQFVSRIAGTSQQFTASAAYTDGTTADVTRLVTWSSSNTTVATISNTSGTAGLATAVNAGQTTITATAKNVTGTATLTVTPPTLNGITSLAVSPSTATILSRRNAAVYCEGHLHRRHDGRCDPSCDLVVFQHDRGDDLQHFGNGWPGDSSQRRTNNHHGHSKKCHRYGDIECGSADTDQYRHYARQRHVDTRAD